MAKILFEHGTILTMEEELYAEAVLVEDGIIKAVGTVDSMDEEELEAAERVDLKGRTLMPAFIDAHGHFSAYANALLQVPLEQAVSFREIQERIRAFIQENKIPKGQWVAAKGYDHNQLEEGIYPDKSVLDAVSPENPLILQHRSGHVGVFNTAALDLMGITGDTKAPEGGVIEKQDGQPTGYMEEAAFLHYQKQVPVPSFPALAEAYDRTQEVYVSYGITAIQEGMMTAQLVPLYQGLLAEGRLKLDLTAYADMGQGEEIRKAFPEHLGQYHRHMKIGGYKIFLDGSPQSRTAWMREPYAGEETYLGYGTMTDNAVYQAVVRAVRENVQLMAHCNGDAACEQYICACEEAVRDGYPVEKIRPVMIHAQLLGIDQLERVKGLGIIPSFFVGHVYHWGDIHIRNFGMERASHISPAKSAQNQGIRFTFHQDAPVTEPDMLETVWCAVNRKTKAGILLGPEERLDVLEALKAVTIYGAYQYFEEEEKGSIRVGKRADLVVLDQNPLLVEKESLREIRVEAVYKDGVSVR